MPLLKSISKAASLTAFLLVLSSGTTWAAPAVLNGNFELGTDGGGVPNWENSSSYPIVGQMTVAGAGVGGSKALQLTTGGEFFGEAIHDYDTSLVVGEEYTVHYSARADVASDLYSSFVYSDSSQDGGNRLDLTTIFADYSFTFTASSSQFGGIAFDYSSVSLGQSVFIDNVYFTGGPADAPEIDPNSAAAPAALTLGVLALLSSRRRKNEA